MPKISLFCASVSIVNTIPACDRQTDRQTHRHGPIGNTHASIGQTLATVSRGAPLTNQRVGNESVMADVIVIGRQRHNDVIGLVLADADTEF